MAISQNFPSIAPSLSLNFASSRTLDPRITFTRTSSATCVGPNGLLRVVPANSPRFDHNPITGESLGLLVEEQRMNLLLRSEEFETTWAASNVTPTANQIAAPSGTTTADLITGNAGTDIKRIRQNVATTSLGPWTFSTWIKTNTADSALIILFDSSAGGANLVRTTLTFSTGAISSATASGTATGASASVQNFGNGWYRVSITGTFVTALTSIWAEVWLDGYTSTANETSFYLWGAQLEVGAFPTSYIPTTTSTVTRSADVASITGSNFSSWYRQDEGTLFAAYQGREGNSSKRVFTFTDDSFSNNAWLIASNSIGSQANYWQVQAGGVVQAELGSGAYSAVPQLSAAAYRADDFGFSKNGGAPLTDTSGSIPVVNTLRIGAGPANTAILNGTIRQLAYWPTRLSNEILQTLTK
jgi:hypothetical protein